MSGRTAMAEEEATCGSRLLPRLVPQPEAVQALGIGLVIVAMLAAELASLALSLKPGSEFLWWLNLQVFRGMNAAYASLAARYPLDYHITIPILLGLGALTASALRHRQRFALGMLSNAAFIWCGFTAYVWYMFQTPLATAGIGDAFYSNFEGWVLMAHVIVASLIGFLVTQLLYWQAVMRGAKAQLRKWKAGLRLADRCRHHSSRRPASNLVSATAGIRDTSLTGAPAPVAAG